MPFEDVFKKRYNSELWEVFVSFSQVIEKKLRYIFNAKEYLYYALSRCCHAIPTQRARRMEHLGDCVLATVVGYMVYETYKDINAGELSDRFDNLTKNEYIAKVCKQYLGVTQLISELGAPSPSQKRCADIFESIVAAIFLDSKQEIKLTSKVILNLFNDFEKSSSVFSD